MPIVRTNHFPVLRWIAGLPCEMPDRRQIAADDISTVPADLYPSACPEVPMAPHGMPWCHQEREEAHERLIADYTSRGGILLAAQVLERLRARRPQPLSVLARWITDRDVISFTFKDRLLLPAFQFQLGDMAVLSPVQESIKALRPMLSDLEIAQWFLMPNNYVGGNRPIECIAEHPEVVERAARIEYMRPRR